MGYSLECYLLDHATLRSAIGSGDAALYHRIVAAESTIFSDNPGVAWRRPLRELIVGERGRLLAQRPPLPAADALDSASDEEAVALTGLIRFVGERVGELIHNSLAGEKFRSMFAPGFGPTPFGRTDLLGRLLQGPVCGLTRAMYPAWGGLIHAELVLLEGGQGDAAWPADGDHRAWLYDLQDVVAQAAEEGRDLVTLYL